MLIGRRREAEILASALQSDKSEFVAVFGRRRVGKTFLVQEAFGNRFSFVHTGVAKGGMKQQLAEFQYSVSRISRRKVPALSDWPSAFHALQEALEALPRGKKVVFIDEMPWMDTPRSGFVSALEHFWNGWANFRKDVLLVVCGSATSWIVDKVINDHGGLHNRVTRRIRVNPFTLAECEEMVRAGKLRLDRRQILEGYMVMGGIPFYWDRIRKGETMAQAVDRLFVAKDAEFADEFDRLYASLFRKPEPYVAVVEALAERRGGKTREELLRDTGAEDNGAFSKVLKELEECGFVAKYRLPGRLTRESTYQLVDNYTLFHFKFLADSAARTKSSAPGYWQRTSESQTGRIWCGFAFERVCFAHVEQMKRALGISGVVADVYAWRHRAEGTGDRGAQVDLVIDRRDGVVNLCEMKYSKGPFAISADYARRLVERAETFLASRRGDATVFLTLVTPAGVKDNEHAGTVQAQITLDDLFRDA